MSWILIKSYFLVNFYWYLRLYIDCLYISIFFLDTIMQSTNKWKYLKYFPLKKDLKGLQRNQQQNNLVENFKMYFSIKNYFWSRIKTFRVKSCRETDYKIIALFWLSCCYLLITWHRMRSAVGFLSVLLLLNWTFFLVAVSSL